MNESFKTNDTLNGTDGKLWISTDAGDTLLGTIQSFSLKQKNIFQNLDRANKLTKSRRLVGIELSGTFVKYKVDNSFVSIMEKYKNGEQPEIKLIGLLENKNSGMMQRAVIKGVTFDEMDIMNFEQKKVLTEEVPYAAEDYYYQDKT